MVNLFSKIQDPIKNHGSLGLFGVKGALVKLINSLLVFWTFDLPLRIGQGLNYSGMLFSKKHTLQICMYH